MDQTTKGNMMFFFGSLLALGAFWLILLGATGGGAVRIALGICAGVAAVAVFRVYATSQR